MNTNDFNQIENNEEVSIPEAADEVTGLKKEHNWKPVFLAFIAVITVISFIVAAYYYNEQQNSMPSSNSVFEEDKVAPSTSQDGDGWDLSETNDNINYGDVFYRKDDKIFADKSNNISINNLELTDADPDTFSFLQGLAGYDKDNFHYLKFDDEAESYVPVSVSIIPEIKQLFDLVESPGQDIKIVWTSEAGVTFENVTYRKMAEYGNTTAFRIEIYEFINNENTIGYLWANGINKTNVANNKLYLYTDSNTSGYVEAVYEVTYGDQPEMILDVEPHKTAFKPSGSKIYYTTSYSSLDLYEYDTVTKTERQIPVQYQSTTTSSSRITLSPDEKYLLVQTSQGRESRQVKTSTLLVDIDSGEVEIVRENETTGFGGDFPFAISPSNDMVFFLNVPYEGYMFSSPFYVKKDAVTGVWSDEINLSSINMEVDGGWNIDTGQWSISPSGRYLAVADATENAALYLCSSAMAGSETKSVLNTIKLVDLETLETQILTTASPDESFTLNSWVQNEDGLYATKRKVQMSKERPQLNCGEPTGEGVREFYPR